MVIITVAYGMRVLLWSREGHLKDMARINWVMVGATIAMFTIATLEMAFGLRHNLEAFVYYTGPGGPNGELSDISNWVNVMRAADYTAQTFIGDGIMVCSMCAHLSAGMKLILRIPSCIDAMLCMTGTTK